MWCVSRVLNLIHRRFAEPFLFLLLLDAVKMLGIVGAAVYLEDREKTEEDTVYN